MILKFDKCVLPIFVEFDDLGNLSQTICRDDSSLCAPSEYCLMDPTKGGSLFQTTSVNSRPLSKLNYIGVCNISIYFL